MLAAYDGNDLGGLERKPFTLEDLLGMKLTL